MNPSNLILTAAAKMANVDPPRIDRATGAEERLVTIRFTCSPILQVMPNGTLATQGENTLDCYVSQLPAIEAMVEDATEADLEAVRQCMGRQTRRWAEKNPGVDRGACPVSFEGAFREIMERDRRPLSNLEILDGSELAPAAPARKRKEG